MRNTQMNDINEVLLIQAFPYGFNDYAMMRYFAKTISEEFVMNAICECYSDRRDVQKLVCLRKVSMIIRHSRIMLNSYITVLMAIEVFLT